MWTRDCGGNKLLRKLRGKGDSGLSGIPGRSSAGLPETGQLAGSAEAAGAVCSREPPEAEGVSKGHCGCGGGGNPVSRRMGSLCNPWIKHAEG